MRLVLRHGNVSVELRGKLGCAGEETSLHQTGLTLTSDREPQYFLEGELSEEGKMVRAGVITPQNPPGLTLELDEGDMCPEV